MSRGPLNDKFKKDIKYLNKDFGGFRRELITFVRNYFPETYNDFNEASPGMMFIELASAVGDILSFYTDIQLRESLLISVEENINLYNIAHSLGYKPKFITPSSVDIDIFQLLPAIGSGENTRPDYRYALQISSNMIVGSDTNVQFRTRDNIDFSYSSSLDPTESSIYSIDSGGNIEYFLLKKTVKATSGNIVTSEFTFTEPKPYDKIVLPQLNALEVIDIVDSDNNTWYETPYLSQDLIPVSLPNLPYNDPYLSQYRVSVPYLLQFKQTERRFVTRLRPDTRIEIQFGSGVSSEQDEEIVPNPFNVGFGLDYFERVVDLSIDPKNFLYTKTYGKAPSNTTLTVRYTVGGGIQDNVTANSITTIESVNITTPIGNLDTVTYSTITESLAVNNPQPARGGISQPLIENIRNEALSNFAAQNRAVTKEDYIVRAYTMPTQFGTIAKACVEVDTLIPELNSTIAWDFNPYGIDLYVLGYDDNKNFSPLNDAVKFNLLNYLKQYRMLTDAVNIKTPYIINIGIDFQIVVNEVFNSNEVLLKTINVVKNLFENDKMGINMPIFKNSILKEIANVQGVITVAGLVIYNLYDTTLGYSGNVYNIELATKNSIIYPSLDPCIFEVKYPEKDIRGKVLNY
jgi:hypothetical protein